MSQSIRTSDSKYWLDLRLVDSKDTRHAGTDIRYLHRQPSDLRSPW